jgi:hypothetical protein
MHESQEETGLFEPIVSANFDLIGRGKLAQNNYGLTIFTIIAPGTGSASGAKKNAR